MATPALGKTQCNSNPSKGLASHYRLIDGKKCWYTGKAMEKVNLAWRISDAKTAKVPKADKAPVDNMVAKPTAIVEYQGIAAPMLEALRITQQLVIFSVIQQEATDYAVDGICGEVTWGVCDRGRLVR